VESTTAGLPLSRGRRRGAAHTHRDSVVGSPSQTGCRSGTKKRSTEVGASLPAWGGGARPVGGDSGPLDVRKAPRTARRLGTGPHSAGPTGEPGRARAEGGFWTGPGGRSSPAGRGWPTANRAWLALCQGAGERADAARQQGRGGIGLGTPIGEHGRQPRGDASGSSGKFIQGRRRASPARS
jgi:hypothetical protein